jgi:hypothetical protein
MSQKMKAKASMSTKYERKGKYRKFRETNGFYASLIFAPGNNNARMDFSEMKMDLRRQD